MSTFDELVLQGIRRKYASDMCKALATQETMEMLNPPPVLHLPLAAEARVLWEKESPEVVVEVRSYHADAQRTIGARIVYSTEAIHAAQDVCALADYVVERLRHEIVSVFLAVQGDADANTSAHP